MDIAIRTIREDEFDGFLTTIAAAFSGSPEAEDLERERPVVEMDRCLAAFDGTEMVGGAAALTFRMAVPGSSVGAAGVSAVGVKPTHRRRGINTALMRHQLDDVHGRGEPIAILYASEGSIYGRFGYGLASFSGAFEIATDRSAYVRGYTPTGTMRMLDRAEALARFREVYQRTWLERPGSIELTPTWFEYRFAPSHFGGEKRSFIYVGHESAGELDAFAVYQVKEDWNDAGPNNELQVEDVQALSPQAYADVWRYVFDIDLIGRVTARNRPVDEPLLHLLREPRRLRFIVRDGLWVRLVDVPSALAARRYASPGRVVLDVRDPFCPWNEQRYLLEGDREGASCSPTTREADLTTTVNELGAAYLGGSSFRRLARAGRVGEDRPGALEAADAMFGWDPAPWCSLFF
jgi:predicted acetyltransferase